MKLQNICNQVTNKISSEKVTLADYVTTDCILQNKEGRTIATNLPPQKCSLTHYKKGDILIANIRPYLRKIWYADCEGGCSADVLVFRANDNHSSDFLYSVLMQDSFYDYVMKAPKGSKMPRGDINHIMNFPIIRDNLSEVKIGKLITSIDKKIEINRQINRNLEELAKQIYDYWFVQFDFPNEEGKPYKSSGGKMVWNDVLKRDIPISWSVSSIAKNPLAKFIKPGVDKFEYKTYFATADIKETEISEGSVIDYENRENRANMQPTEYSVWFAKMKNSIKHLYLNPEMKPIIEGSILSTGFCGLQCNEISFEYISSFIASPYFELHKDMLAHGATQEAVNNEDLAGINLLIPNECILKEYHNTTQYLYANISRIICENKVLIKFRDWLLPLLMNGQVTLNSCLSDD